MNPVIKELLELRGFLLLAMLVVVALALVGYAIFIYPYDRRLAKNAWRARQEQKLAGLKRILIYRHPK